MSLKKYTRSTLRGFTLIELLVSVSIMAIILGITLSGGPQALMRLSLADNTYAVELLVREAQLQGSAVNSVSGTYGGAGVFFNRVTSGDVIKFKDRVDPTIAHPIGVGNGLYNLSGLSELDTTYKITNKHRITTLCVATSTPPFVCNTSNNPPIDTLTISFTRPSQSARIYVNGATTTSYGAACIQVDSIRSPQAGYVRSVVVYKSGMITKRSGTCMSI